MAKTGNAYRSAVMAAALLAAVPGCRGPRTISIETVPEGAAVSIYQDRELGGIGRRSRLPVGEWVYMGQSPVADFEYVSGNSFMGAAIAYTLSLPTIVPPILFACGTSNNPKYYVRVRKRGYHPLDSSFVMEDAPSDAEFTLRLHPLERYSFNLESVPSGAMVEVYDEVKQFSPVANDWESTGRFDFIYAGRTPLRLEDYMDEGDGLLTVRLSKRGHEDRILDLPLGRDEYAVELDPRN